MNVPAIRLHTKDISTGLQELMREILSERMKFKPGSEGYVMCTNLQSSMLVINSTCGYLLHAVGDEAAAVRPVIVPTKPAAAFDGKMAAAGDHSFET